MTDLKPIPEPPPIPEKIDLNSPEDVLIEVVGPHDDNTENKNWSNWSIESTTIINGQEGIIGAASYEDQYGGCLDYTIASLIDCPGAGWFVVPDVTAIYIRGDNWEIDDDMEFNCGEARPATAEEITQA